MSKRVDEYTGKREASRIRINAIFSSLVHLKFHSNSIHYSLVYSFTLPPVYFKFRFNSIAEISTKAGAIFGELFSEKMFRAQLSFFADIDFNEPLEYLPPAVPEREIREFLTEKATEVF
jgi:hypothetical protein